MSELENIVFYHIDRAIRSYRHLAQQRFKSEGIEVTVDQWIVMKCLVENPESTQMELAEKVFKDNASVTRILNLLVKQKLIRRSPSKKDRRRTDLTITEAGMNVIEKMAPIIEENRAKALAGLSKEEIDLIRKTMSQIQKNCTE
ncbi:MAG: MarR family transcriptional regulator [Crocinitomicaceae bacterium]|jgi:DNA-binding MarR family transcriptional regulator|nr:MarR family transcriptional regulator [Crocinitomicaceae bacterium]